MTLQLGSQYSAIAYIDELGRLDLSPRPAIVGLLKLDPTGKQLLYAHPDSCDAWIDLPEDQIEEIEHLGVATCRDHHYARARIFFREVADPGRKALLALALMHHEFSVRTDNGPKFPMCPPGQHPCYDAGTERWTCCKD